MGKENTNLSAELWDQTLVPMERCCEKSIIRIGEATITVRPYVVDWIAYDLILGKPWISEANSLIDWQMNCMLLKPEEKFITLDTEARKHGEAPVTYLLTRKNRNVSEKQKSTIHYVVWKPSQEEGENTIENSEKEIT